MRFGPAPQRRAGPTLWARGGAALAFVLLVGACGSTSPADLSAAAECGDPRPFGDFGQATVRVTAATGDVHDGCYLVADTGEQRSRGLMEVTDLAEFSGMLFVYDSDGERSFWMRNTPMPLSIAYLDGDGGLVSTAAMEPCDDLPSCVSYSPEGPFRLALEVPRGDLEAIGLGPGAVVTVR